MRRDELGERYGITTVLVLALRGVHPREYLRRVGDPSDPLTTRDERDADFFLRDIDAAEMCRRVEWLSKLPFEVITRPAVPGSPDRLPLAPAQTMRLASDVARHAAHFEPSQITEAAAHAAISETFAVLPDDAVFDEADDWPALASAAAWADAMAKAAEEEAEVARG